MLGHDLLCALYRGADQHTAYICWHVPKALFHDYSTYIRVHTVHVLLKHHLLFHTSTKVCVPFHRSASSRSDLSEEGLAGQRATVRESIKRSRLSVSQSAQKAEQSGTAALPLLISSIDCLNGCHWRWRDRQAAFVKFTELSCDGPLSLILYWRDAEGYTSTYGGGRWAYYSFQHFIV